MSDIFISYARPNEPLAKAAGEALRAAGYRVWRDDELPAHRAYSEVIEERIKSAKAVLVLWSNDAVRSQWVRAEADAARELGTLVQVSIDGVLPPMPFNQIQCADLMGWTGEASLPGWQKAVSSIASLAGAVALPNAPAGPPSTTPARKVVICVLPFLNMSGDAEQEYFSDGISEDIITDLAKVSALTIVARNIAFAFKGKQIDNGALGRDLGVTHVLEGSVRKAGERVRINAQLIDAAAGHQIWADRYDRDLTDIFAIQDEISKAIVAALQLKLLPREKKAIEHRGTSSPEAYNLYLLARQHWISGNKGDQRRDKVVVRICQQAVAIDPDYARAWALMSLAQCELRYWHGIASVDALTAAERALSLDPEIAEAYCVRARYLQEEGKFDEANEALATALRHDPDSWEVNKEVAFLTFRQGQVREAIPYFEKATALMETDFHDANMLNTCYSAIGDGENVRRTAQLTVSRIEKIVAQDPSNGFAMGTGAYALAALGDARRAREWAERAMLIDPENASMRYNLACGMVRLGELDAAFELLEPQFKEFSMTQLLHCWVDPDMDRLRDDPRFDAMVNQVLARHGVTRNALPGERSAQAESASGPQGA
ncbi:TIR domain-containing protein [Sphingomonas sp.]|uniref:TIR domain-containing protein n=1 Tax=Sphingomonas sp. TaxID=28214 RepID=UPI001B169450|nr:TIR domain-containing protein [Sphingomonas sp.]MBO9715138.1 TIR domain-containing protein [Sphingomonas sp.]